MKNTAYVLCSPKQRDAHEKEVRAFLQKNYDVPKEHIVYCTTDRDIRNVPKDVSEQKPVIFVGLGAPQGIYGLFCEKILSTFKQKDSPAPEFVFIASKIDSNATPLPAYVQTVQPTELLSFERQQEAA